MQIILVNNMEKIEVDLKNIKFDKDQFTRPLLEVVP